MGVHEPAVEDDPASANRLGRLASALRCHAVRLFLALATFSALFHAASWYWHARGHAVGVDGPFLFFADPTWSPPLGWWPRLLVAATATLAGVGGRFVRVAAGAGTLRTVSGKRLVRPREGRMIAGVCAGIADRLGVSRTLVRLAFVLSIVLPGPQVLLYVLLWIVMPSEP